MDDEKHNDELDGLLRFLIFESPLKLGSIVKKYI